MGHTVRRPWPNFVLNVSPPFAPQNPLYSIFYLMTVRSSMLFTVHARTRTWCGFIVTLILVGITVARAGRCRVTLVVEHGVVGERRTVFCPWGRPSVSVQLQIKAPGISHLTVSADIVRRTGT